MGSRRGGGGGGRISVRPPHRKITKSCLNACQIYVVYHVKMYFYTNLQNNGDNPNTAYIYAPIAMINMF